MSIISVVVMTVGSIASGAITRHIGNRILNGKLCFAVGTLVLCKGEDGEECHKPIEDVKEGDLVWAYDEDSGKSDWKEVVQLFRNESSALCHVEVEGEDEPIISTPGHKYFVPENKACRDVNERLEHTGYVELSDKWVSAKDLKAGDKILLSDGKYGTIKSIKFEQLDKPIAVYNFEVKDFHTYYVGKNGVCTHNANCGVGGKGWEGDATWKANVKTVSQGGDVPALKGGIPTQTQAEKLIMQGKGTLLRAEAAHALPNPHTFSHINYLTHTGSRGAIRILDPFIPMIY